MTDKRAETRVLYEENARDAKCNHISRVLSVLSSSYKLVCRAQMITPLLSDPGEKNASFIYLQADRELATMKREHGELENPRGSEERAASCRGRLGGRGVMERLERR